MSWREHAACRGVNADLFFVDRNESTAPAKAICAACPVKRDCLQYALRERIEVGVWGGLSARQRKRLRHTHPSMREAS